MTRVVVPILAVLAALAAGAAFAHHSPLHVAGSAGELLEPEKAFMMSARALDARTVEVSFAIADGYYMYRDKFGFAADPASRAKLGAPQFPAGVRKKDEFFGEVETYRRQVAIRLPVESQEQSLRLTVTSQGCADVGVCYAPFESQASIRLAAFGDGAARAASGAALPISTQASDLEIARLFESGGFWIVLASFLGFGLLLAFTPCVLPMIPILSGIIVGEGEDLSKMRALLLADVTANTAEHKALLKRFSLFGPPGIVFFDAQGREIKGLRVIGYQDSERFLRTLEHAKSM
ncbi:MAG: protein-disulfide reductase DsbD domain-containing protein [Burkholderiales bacterium]